MFLYFDDAEGNGTFTGTKKMPAKIGNSEKVSSLFKSLHATLSKKCW